MSAPGAPTNSTLPTSEAGDQITFDLALPEALRHHTRLTAVVQAAVERAYPQIRLKDRQAGCAVDVQRVKEYFHDRLDCTVRLDAPLCPEEAADLLELHQGARRGRPPRLQEVLDQLAQPYHDNYIAEHRAALDSPDPERCQAAAKALAPFPEALPHLREAIAPTIGNEKRYAALAGIAEAPPGQLAEDLLAILSNPDEHYRIVCRALDGLAYLREPRATEPIAAILARCNNDDHSAAILFSRAANALGRIATPDAVDTLLPLLETDRGSHRSEAANALAAAGHARALRAVERLALDEPEPFYRAVTVRALGTTSSPTTLTVDTLVRIIDHDPIADVRRAGVDVLAAIGGPATVQALARAVRNDPDAIVRIAAVERLADVPTPAATEAIAHALQNDRDRGVRNAAAGAERIIRDSAAPTPALPDMPSPAGPPKGIFRKAVRAIRPPNVRKPHTIER